MVTNRKVPEVEKAWRQTARLKLKFELAGLSFALSHGFSVRDYARHLWSTGAKGWLGKADPSPEEYLVKEAEACRKLLPEVRCDVFVVGSGEARLLFLEGCPGGWGRDRWGQARKLGLEPADVCAYCNEAFATWAEEVKLQAVTSPQRDGTCDLTVRNPHL